MTETSGFALRCALHAVSDCAKLTLATASKAEKEKVDKC